MKKVWIKTIAISVLAAYVFTMTFGFMDLHSITISGHGEQVEMAFSEEDNKEQPAADIAYFAAAINKLYNTIVSIGKVI